MRSSYDAGKGEFLRAYEHFWIAHKLGAKTAHLFDLASVVFGTLRFHLVFLTSPRPPPRSPPPALTGYPQAAFQEKVSGDDIPVTVMLFPRFDCFRIFAQSRKSRTAGAVEKCSLRRIEIGGLPTPSRQRRPL